MIVAVCVVTALLIIVVYYCAYFVARHLKMKRHQKEKRVRPESKLSANIADAEEHLEHYKYLVTALSEALHD